MYQQCCVRPDLPRNNVLYKCISLEAEERQCLVECSKHIYLVAIIEFLSFFSLTASNVIFAPPLKRILMIVYKHLCISIINCTIYAIYAIYVIYALYAIYAIYAIMLLA